ASWPAALSTIWGLVMSATSYPGRSALPVVREGMVRVAGRSTSFVRSALIIGLAVLLVVLHPQVPEFLPVASFVPLIVLGGMVLPLRAMLITFSVITLLIVGVMLWGPDQPYVMGPVACGVTMGAMLAGGLSRSRHGVGAFTGDRMISELRDTLFAA